MPLPRRAHRLEVHWSQEEWAALQRRGRGAGVSLAAYVRAAALGQPVPVAAAVPPVNLEQYAELGRAAANLNQLARHLNLGNVLTDRDLLPVLQQLHRDLQQVRRALLGMDGRACLP